MTIDLCMPDVGLHTFCSPCSDLQSCKLHGMSAGPKNTKDVPMKALFHRGLYAGRPPESGVNQL